MKDGKRMTKLGIGVDAYETRLLASQVVVARLRRNSTCSMCTSEKLPPVINDDGHWIHLYADGAFLGPCFDPMTAKKLTTARAKP